MSSSPVIVPDWSLPQGVKAFTTVREGGFSLPPYAQSNMGLHVGDNPAHVALNRALLPHHQNIAWLNQVHGTNCIEIKQVPNTPISADASYTALHGVVCGVMTADCVPLLVCDKQATVVAAIHAGWKGLAGGIIEHTISSLQRTGKALLVWIGPAISQAKFEVGTEVAQAFSAYPQAIKASENKDKCLIDLVEICRQKLHTIGIVDISCANQCTYQEELLYFSHRRATHRGESQTGRMFSGIYLE